MNRTEIIFTQLIPLLSYFILGTWKIIEIIIWTFKKIKELQKARHLNED